MNRKHILLVSAVAMISALTITTGALFQGHIVNADDTYYTLGIGGVEGNMEHLSGASGYAVTANGNQIRFEGSNISFNHNYSGYLGIVKTDGASFFNVTPITGIRSIYLEHDAYSSNTSGCSFTIEWGQDQSYGGSIVTGLSSRSFELPFNDTLPSYFKITIPQMPEYALDGNMIIKRIVIKYTC